MSLKLDFPFAWSIVKAEVWTQSFKSPCLYERGRLNNRAATFQSRLTFWSPQIQSARFARRQLEIVPAALVAALVFALNVGSLVGLIDDTDLYAAGSKSPVTASLSALNCSHFIGHAQSPSSDTNSMRMARLANPLRVRTNRISPSFSVIESDCSDGVVSPSEKLTLAPGLGRLQSHHRTRRTICRQFQMQGFPIFPRLMPVAALSHWQM